MLVYTIIAVLLVIFWPANAYAWGPGTHLEVALSLVKDAALLSPIVAGLIARYRDEFVYGMVSADILMGKKYAGYLHHCHNWNIAWGVLAACKTDKERASAYGYLAHLAADVVAHNYYIPYMMIESFATKMKQHTYWEMRFDMSVRPAVWDEMKNIISGDFSEFDRLLEKNLKRPLFSFKINKRVFNTILLLQKFKQTRNAVELHAKVMQWPLTRAEVRHYKFLITRMTRELLTKFERAECQKGEPIGQQRLAYARNLRRKLRKMDKEGKVTKKSIEKFLERVKLRLKETMLDPSANLPNISEL